MEICLFVSRFRARLESDRCRSCRNRGERYGENPEPHPAYLPHLHCYIFIVSIVISKYFSLRVSKIVSVLDSFQEGAFHKRAQFKGNDEFTHIASALNDMGAISAS